MTLWSLWSPSRRSNCLWKIWKMQCLLNTKQFTCTHNIHIIRKVSTLSQLCYICRISHCNLYTPHVGVPYKIASSKTQSSNFVRFFNASSLPPKYAWISIIEIFSSKSYSVIEDLLGAFDFIFYWCLTYP